MRFDSRLWLALLGGLILTGCGPGKETPAPTETSFRPASVPANANATNRPVPTASQSSPTSNRSASAADLPAYHLDHAQPKLATTKLWIGPKEMDAEVARTRTQVSTGLMFRQGIGPNEGMLFVFAQPHQPAFYMKNVNFEIAAAYVDAAGVVQDIVKLKARDEQPVPSKSANIQFVLETAPDWWERNGLGVGTLIRTDKLSLRENFLGR